MPYTTAAPYAEEAYSVREEFDVFGGVSSAAVTLRCAWADRYTIAGDILGNLRVWPQGTGSAAVATRGTIRAVENDAYTITDGFAVYGQALIDLVYSSAIPDDAGGGGEESTTNPTLRILDSLEPSIEFQKLDHNQFRWGDANGRVLKKDEAPGRQLRSMSLMRTIYGFTTIPSSVLTLPGKVNTAAFNSIMLGINFAAETLLFTPPSLQVRIMSDGSKSRNATLKLLYKPEGWNKFWNAEAQAYQKIWDADFNNGVGREYNNYPLGDMSDWLFN